jgi:hypothetical protein
MLSLLVFTIVYRQAGDTVSHVFDPALCNVYYCPSNLLYGSPPSSLSPLPKVKVQNIQTKSGWEGMGWGVLSCVGDHILQEFITLFLTRFRAYKIATPPQTKT